MLAESRQDPHLFALQERVLGSAERVAKLRKSFALPPFRYYDPFWMALAIFLASRFISRSAPAGDT